ncbi:GntR family transcriptional regulator [Streptosporangium sp. NPDC004379]|uniref:GntR family transcriptional regulator n=1 Tax=Streptosporangium sp. NPDC004379 TaxID=3366189 RepID=UPI0036B5EFC9
MLDHDGDTHLYLQIAEIIRKRISAERLSPGEHVASEADIKREFGVARTTARRALRLLREEGLVYALQGEGTFVGPPGIGVRQPSKTPMYRQIAEDVIERIRSGAIRPRRPIPSEMTLTQEYDVARETARRAVALLREQGWIYTVPQRGSYVSPEEKWPGAAAGR